MRKSEIVTESDKAGTYEIEVFKSDKPKGVIICSHGNGVRRWDGERFFYNVAEHYPDHIFLLVDQNQPYEDGCKLNDLAVMIRRVQDLITKAKTEYPNTPIIVVGHSMGCGVIARLDLAGVSKVIFVAPTAGSETAKLQRRYGNDIAKGKLVKTTDGLTKFLSKEYVQSVQGIVWEKEYRNLLNEFSEVYVFESGDEELVGDERLTHRHMPFASYKIISGATHNYTGASLKKLYTELDGLI